MARASSLGSPMRTSGLRSSTIQRVCHLAERGDIRKTTPHDWGKPQGFKDAAGPLSVLHPALEDGEPDDVDSTAETELAHPVRLVNLDGLDAETELCGDF